MISYEWDRRGLEEQLLIKPFKRCEISLHIIIDGIDITWGSFADPSEYFPSLYGAFCFLDPNNLDGSLLRYFPNNQVSFGCSEYIITYSKDDVTLLNISFQSPETLEWRHLTVTFRDFVESSLEANHRFFIQCLETIPELINNEYFIDMNPDFTITKNWYYKKWGITQSFLDFLHPKYDPQNLIEHEFILPHGKGTIPLYKEDFFFFQERHVAPYYLVGKTGNTLFPMKDGTHYDGKPYPGTSDLSEDGLKQLIADALTMSSPVWPTNRTYTLVVEFPEERYGIREMEIWVCPRGIENVYPTKGSQVFKWYDERWNPCPGS